MKVTKKQLNLIIESFLKEEDWYNPEDEDVEINSRPELKERLSRLKNECIQQIIKELKESDYKGQNIPEGIIKRVVKTLKQVNLTSTKVKNSEYSGIKALAITSNIIPDHNNELVLQMSQIPDDVNDIPQNFVDQYNSSPSEFPMIIFFESNLSADITDKTLKEIILHELGHVKNDAIRATSFVASKKQGEKIGKYDDLNLEEVRALLRKDLKGKTVDETIDILVKEGWLEKDKNNMGEAKLVKELKRYYDGVFSDPVNEIGLEEISARASALKRNKTAISKFVTNREVDLYRNIMKNFNSDIADIVILLSKEAKVEDLNKIVKLQKSSNSATV